MVYYSPYKNIIRAFIRAIRVFICSLFSKRLLLMIIIALFILLLHLNVQADSIYQDGYAYRNVRNNGYIEEKDAYEFIYRIYTRSSLQEGTVLVPSDIYNSNKWLMFIDPNDIAHILKVTDNHDTVYLNYIRNDRIFFLSLNPNTYEFRGTAIYYTYDSSNETWSSVTESNLTQLKFRNDDINALSANSIIYKQNLDFIYYDQVTSQSLPYDSYINSRILSTPRLMLRPNIGFRLYLNDFKPFTGSSLDEDWEEDYNLTEITDVYLRVFDINNNTYVTDILHLPGIDIEDDDNYFIDIFFDDTLNYMNILDGDYIIYIATTLNSVMEYPIFNNSKFNMTTNYLTVDFWRYTYYSSSGAGILKSIYADGTEKPNQNNEINPSQNENTIDFSNLTNSINNQTTIIQNQTNIINDMSNFIQDNNFNTNTITNNMPNSNDFQDITQSGFDNIFTTLRNAFTSDTYTDVIFTVPFSNGQNITIPSNLTENIIPTIIKNLIQMVYWFLISRFIVKDIANYIEKAKSGDIFNSSDTNIKTDML